MPLETLQHSVRQPTKTAVAPAPPRLRPKGPVGPDFYRKYPPATSRPRQSAVERLEADKAKYVKSQVVLTKQQPVTHSEMRNPLLSPSSAPWTTRKTPVPDKAKQEGVQLDVEHLSNLISGVNDTPQFNASVKSNDHKPPGYIGAAHRSPRPTPLGAQQKKEKPCPPPRPDWSSAAKVRLKPSGSAEVESPTSPGPPAAGTVRRVDVVPQAGPARTAVRRPQVIRQPLQPIFLQSKLPLCTAASNLRLFHPRTTPGPSPRKPVVVPSKPDTTKPDTTPTSSAESPVPAPPPPSLPVLPPPSPAITRLSSTSSRKRPSLTRSKSDMSDRYSRAGTDLERFFNLCGLDPADLQELTGSSSDIVSMARFRSVSAPGSECAGSDREGEDDEDDEETGKDAGRVPYGVSVIERNARVIKWLYGIKQAKDNTTKSTNL